MRRPLTFVSAVFLMLLVGMRLGATLAQTPHLIYLPAVHNGAAVSGASIVLDAGDNALVDSVRSSDGRCTFLAYIDRDDGNLLHIVQDAGDHLIDVPLPPVGQVATAPAFTPPGEKQADGSLLVHNGLLTLYFTSRLPDDEHGAFQLQRLDMPEPVCQFG